MSQQKTAKTTMTKINERAGPNNKGYSDLNILNGAI